ncbi:MAG: tRNA lysidine(34) synthetase TilS, partial [Kiritimatiellae bacterium]|nr:tRNA lysidine(34) synthetase TilS [Kiritimatiellia bacterium]
AGVADPGPRSSIAATEKLPRSSGPNSNAESVRAFSVCLVVPGKTRLLEQGCRIIASIGPGIVKEQSMVIGALPAHASLSLRAWRKRRLVARSWKPGDRMRPLGMQGTKKLQDIFSDGKVPPTLRHRLPVIECQGEIVWIPGFRIAQGWEVHPDESLALQLQIS